jgi:single-stranded-DNA-specific exonuclease
MLGPLGVHVARLTGESTPEERERVYAGLAEGSLDVVLTTPEFLDFHASKLAASGRIGFVVVDEAHHIGQAIAGARPAYAHFGATLATLGNPARLAVTATADDEVCARIREELGCNTTIIDDTARENLHLDDAREIPNRELYAATIVAAGEQTIIYVNARTQAMELTRALRKRLPNIASKIAFYHAGMTPADRLAVEAAFRAEELSCIVCTSAFGEGVDIPHVRRVLLYQLPYSAIELNQSSGRAGRDGADAMVHVLYTAADAPVNEHILASLAPNHAQMATLYRAVAARAHAGGHEPCSAEDLLAACQTIDRHTQLGARAITNGLAVFAELGLVRIQDGDTNGPWRLDLIPTTGKLDLMASTRYAEGVAEQEAFAAFRDWALTATAEELLARLNTPITPGGAGAGGAKAVS